MQFGLQINPYTGNNPWEHVERAARALDASAFDSLWIYDHFLYEGGYPGHPVPEPVMECFTTLGAIAAITHRIRLGQLVIGVPYRNPAMMAKMATSLDLISRGRSILGLGAGWHQREHEAYGWGDFEAPGVRLKRLREAIQVTLALWSDRPATYQGEYYQLQDVMDLPLPLQRPHPPILIGGRGPRVTLRLAAQYAQICNYMGGPPAAVREFFGGLREHCEQVGRPYDEVTRSTYATVVIAANEAELKAKRERLGSFMPPGTLSGTRDELVDRVAEFAAAGCQYLIFRMPDWYDIGPVQQFAEEVIPTLAGV